MGQKSKPPKPLGHGKTVVFVWLFSLLGIVAMNAVLFAAPALKHRAPGLSALIYAAFAPFCHQIPERCLVIQDHPLPVCGRCLGIYLGFVAGMIFYPFLRGFSRLSPPSTKFFIFVSLPLAVDVAGVFCGIWAGSIPLRLATGFIWGTILPYYWMSGLSQAVLLISKKRDRAR